jgi:hypothetical protein
MTDQADKRKKKRKPKKIKTLEDCFFCAPNLLARVLAARVSERLHVCEYHRKAR